MAKRKAVAVCELSAEEFAHYLKANGMKEDDVRLFQENEITGAELQQLDDCALRELFPLLGHRLKVKRLLTEIQSTSSIIITECRNAHQQENELEKENFTLPIQVLNCLPTPTEDMLLPIFSERVQTALFMGNPLPVWKYFVQELAEFVNLHYNVYTKEHYKVIGKTMFKKYPCIESNGTEHPWSFLTKCLSQRIRRLKWVEKRRTSDTTILQSIESKFSIEETPISCGSGDYSSSYILPEAVYCDTKPELPSSDCFTSPSGEFSRTLSLTQFSPEHHHRPPMMSPARGIHTLPGRTPFGVQYEAPLEILKPLSVPKKLLLGAGPANTPRRICEASGMPMLGHLHPEFLKIMDETKAGIQYAFQTKNQYTFCISGTGHCAMEAALCNILEPGDRAIVVCTGIWGERASNMAERCGAVVSQLKVPLGEVASAEAIQKEIEKQPEKPKLVFVCHGESSTGILQPLEGLGELCHKNNCLLLVDTVASLGGAPVHMDALGIDIMYSGSQKVLNAPPGISPISFSEKAIDHVRNRKTKVQSYYLDALLLGNYWNCDNQPIGYHHTGMVTLVYALREGLSILAEETLQASWKRHKANAELLYTRLEESGLKPFIKEQKHRLPTITSVEVPEGVDGKLVSEYCMKKFALELAGGLGPTVGKIWRIGLMGCNSSPRNVDFAIRAIDEAIASCTLQNKL